MTTRYYHRTGSEIAEAILDGGFRDGKDACLTGREHVGVWISDRPLDANEGANGDALRVVEIHADLVTPYEWVNDPSMGYREFLVPLRALAISAGSLAAFWTFVP
jgi:hypothetical protein